MVVACIESHHQGPTKKSRLLLTCRWKYILTGYLCFSFSFFSPPTFPFHTGCCDTSVCSLLHSDIWIQIDVVYPAVLERGAISLGLVCVYLTPCAFRSLCRFSQWWAHHTHNYTFGRIRLILGETLWGCSSQNQWHVLSAGTNEAFQCPMPTNEVLEMFSIAGGGEGISFTFLTFTK